MRKARHPGNMVEKARLPIITVSFGPLAAWHSSLNGPVPPRTRMAYLSRSFCRRFCFVPHLTNGRTATSTKCRRYFSGRAHMLIVPRHKRVTGRNTLGTL